MGEAVITMLVDDPQPYEGSLPMFESEEVAEMTCVPSLEGALGGEVHKAEQEGGEEEVLWVIPGGGSEVPTEMENVGEDLLLL